MAALRLLPSIGGLALAIVAAACAAPTPTPEPTATPAQGGAHEHYEHVTQELLPGMQWGELEPGLERYVRSCGSSARCTGAIPAIAPGESGRFIDDAARERGEALAELAADAYLVDDDNLYLRWRKIEDRATGSKNALFDQLADLRERNGLPDRGLTDEEWEALSPREYALELWYRIIRMEDDAARDDMLDWWVSEYEGTDEGDYVLRNTNQAMRMPLALNSMLGKTAQMKAVKASAEAMARHILRETGDPAADRYREWFWMLREQNEAVVRKMDALGYPPAPPDDDRLDYVPEWRDGEIYVPEWRDDAEEASDAALVPTPTPTPLPTATPRPTATPGHSCPVLESYYNEQGRLLRRCVSVAPDGTPRPTATPRPTPTPRPTATPTPTPTPALYDFRRNSEGMPAMWNGEKWITWEDVRPCWETTPAPGSQGFVIWSLVDCDTRGALGAATTPTTRPFVERRAGQCYAEPPSRIWTNGYWVRIDCPPPPPATPTPIPCPSTGYGAMSCVRAWPAGVPVRAAVECWIDAECGGFEYYDYVTKLDASEPVLYWAAPDLARRNPVVVNQVGRALRRMTPLLGVEFRETESRDAARLVIRMEEDRECKSEQAGACGGARGGRVGTSTWSALTSTIGWGEIMIRTRYTNPDSAYRMLIHEMGHALTGMGHSYRCGSLMRDWEDEGFIRGCVAAGYPRYHREFSSMDEAVMLINSHPAVAAGTRRADWRDFICGRDC